jgi:hypothetical protein
MEESVHKYIFIIILALFSLALQAQVEWANAVPLRQGVNIEWFRTGTETADGCAIYVWSDTKLGARDLYAQKVDASGNMVWGQPLLVDGKIDRQEDPVVTRTSDDNFIISWIDFSDDLDGNVYAQKVSQSGTLLWQTGGVPVCVYPGIQIALNIEPDNSGGAYIIWEDSRNPGKDLYGQHLSNTGAPVTGWAQNGNPIANNEGDESYNTMWADGTGGLIIGYVYALSGSESLLIKRFLPNGNMAWTQPLVLSPSAYIQNKIKMAQINNDSFVFTWMDFRNTDPDIYAQRVTISGSVLWPDPLVVYTDSTATVPAPQENPRIVQTSDNGVIIIWEDKRNDVDDPDLFAQKVNLSGQRLWDVNGIPLSVAEFGQRGPRMSADNSGGCYVVWDDSRNGNAPNVDIYAQHLSSSGSSLWQANGQAVCTASNEQSGSLIKLAGNNIFINWMDTRTGSVGINYQVLNTSGTALLAQNGVEVFWGLSGDATLKEIIHLPRQNDTVVIWQDTRFANLGYQIFFQTINADGSVDFETNGKPVTTLTGNDQSNPAAVVLPDNKIAIVWEEKRTSNPKIFGQLLDSNGDRLWGDTGIAITDSEPLRQKDPKISYHNGALYIGWSNLDNVTTPNGTRQLFHIHGQKIEGNQKMWGADGLLISQVPTADPLFECQLETIVESYYVWTRTSVNPDTFGALNVWVKSVNPDGTTADGWSDFGVVTSNYNDYDLNQYLPKAAMTTAGIFIEWLDFRGDFIKNLYGQMISPSGQILWNPSGISLADYGHEQDEFSILGGLNATFVWKESVAGDNQDIAVSRYSTLGTPMWGAMGGFIVERDTTQSSPNLARFSNGGMVVAWEDYSDESADIYMRYMEDDGSLLAPSTGIMVCNEIMIQQYPLIAVLRDTTPNKAIIVWSDGRSSGKTPIYGLYARKIGNPTISPNEDDGQLNIPPVTLQQNYPNPFNPETRIAFNLQKNFDNVELAIYNLKGQKVCTLHSGLTEKGNYNYTWNGRDRNDKKAASGIYFYKLTAGDKTLTRKMILLK